MDNDGDVNYRAWHASKADLTSLQQFIRSLSVANPKARSSSDAQLAFWINAYNAGVQAQLATNTKDFFSRPQNFRYEPNRNVFHLSQIMNWYGTDFGNDQRAQLKAVAASLPTAAAQAAAKTGNGTIKFVAYDWNLNVQKSRRRVVGNPR